MIRHLCNDSVMGSSGSCNRTVKSIKFMVPYVSARLARDLFVSKMPETFLGSKIAAHYNDHKF